MEAVEIDKELEDLEHRIDQLRALYEQYFMGIERLEPQKPRQEIERRIKILRKEQIRNTAQRFKFNVLVQRLNTLQQYWGRVVREIENGTFKRDVLKAAARFGDTALTGLGKKRAAELAKLAASQPKRAVDDAYELGADDLIEDDDYELADEEDEDEAPTPPKLGAPPSARGLLPGDLPLIQPAPSAAPPAWGAAPYAAVPSYAPAGYAPAGYAPAAAGASQAPAAPVAPSFPAPAAPMDIPPYPPAPLPVTAPPPAASGPRTGLRWGGGSSDPGSSVRPAAVDVKRRVAELAAEARSVRPPGGDAGFGALDLDFDDGSGARSPAGPLPPVPRFPGTPAPGAPAVGPSMAPAPRPAPVSGFGVLDVPLDEPRPQAIPAPSPSSPGSGIRPGVGQPRPAVSTPPVAARPAPAVRPQVSAAPPPPPSSPAAAPRPGELGDQRLRQIYAKYVETKRAANESTAGVTYENLAATLRAQAEKLKAQHPSKAIDYEVVIKDGKTHLKPVLR